MIRNYVPAAAVTLLAVAMVGGVFAVGIAPTTASAATLASQADSTLEGSSASGEVDEISIDVSGELAWENLGSEPEEVRVRVIVTDGPGARDLATETYTDVPSETSGSYSFDGVSGDVLADTGYTAGDFSAGEDGETREETFTVGVEAAVVTADGEERLTSDSHTMDVVVTNEETQQHQPASSDLEASVSGQIHMNETSG